MSGVPSGAVTTVEETVSPGIAAADLVDFGTRLLRAAGMAEAEAATVSDMLAETSLRGTDSHGVMRLPVYARRCRAGGIISPARICPVRDSGGVAVLDGGAGAGHVIGQAAVDAVVTRAAAQGVAAVGVRNGNHLGALALYANRIAERGQIGIVMTNASPRIAPTGGYEALLGNNPWAIGVPYPTGPLVMDIAHSVVAVGKIRMSKTAGTPLPEGWARDSKGRPTTDPDEALSGLVEPVGGHKGYALVFMIDILCAALTGAASGRDTSGLFDIDQPSGVGHQFVALDVGHFGDRENFAHRVSGLVDLIRSSGRAPGVEQIHVPGDPEKQVYERRVAHGIPLTAPVAADLRAAATEFSVDVPAWLTQLGSGREQ